MLLVKFLLVAIYFQSFSFAYEVLMVVGGYYYENGGNIFLSNAEVVGKHNSCEIAPLPEPRLGLTVARLKRTVVACGGFHIYERWDCFTYYPRQNRWLHQMNLPDSSPLVFASSAGHGSDFFIAGGRRYNGENNTWAYSRNVRAFDARRRRWRELPGLETPTADGCLLALNGHLIFIAGSKDKYRYASDPSKVWTLLEGSQTWRDDVIRPLLAQRMWQACAIVEISGEVGIVVSGGYYNGLATMFYPINDDLRIHKVTDASRSWRLIGNLPEERKWGPALGMIDGVLTIAGGQNYGDNTIDVYVPSYKTWMKSGGKKLLRKREFASHATVPSEWFPQCGF